LKGPREGPPGHANALGKSHEKDKKKISKGGQWRSSTSTRKIQAAKRKKANAKTKTKFRSEECEERELNEGAQP